MRKNKSLLGELVVCLVAFAVLIVWLYCLLEVDKKVMGHIDRMNDCYEKAEQ